jgi:hypothetical protein
MKTNHILTAVLVIFILTLLMINKAFSNREIKGGLRNNLQNKSYAQNHR